MPVDKSSFYARRLKYLFDTVRKKGGSVYTLREVEQGTKALAAENDKYQALSYGYIWKITDGRVRNPSYAALLTICKFFGVPITFFDEDTPEEVPPEAVLFHKLEQDESASSIAEMATSMNEPDQEVVRAMMRTILEQRQKDANA